VLCIGVELVSLVAVGWLAGDRVVVRLVRGDDPAILAEGRILEKTVVVASVVDAGRHEDSCATVVVQARLEAEVLDDAGDDALLALARAATAARMSQETVAAQDMLARFAQWRGQEPESVAADTTYGNGEFLQWLADRSITPYMRTRDSIHRKRSPFFGPERFTTNRKTIATSALLASSSTTVAEFTAIEHSTTSGHEKSVGRARSDHNAPVLPFGASSSTRNVGILVFRSSGGIVCCSFGKPQRNDSRSRGNKLMPHAPVEKSRSLKRRQVRRHQLSQQIRRANRLACQIPNSQ
jgi:hypothetical protein